MARSFALLYTILTDRELFWFVKEELGKYNIKLEVPNTDKVQMWSSEGEMVSIHKKEFFSILPNINKYLIQFWWSELNDLSIQINHYANLSECIFYLDGLDEKQFRDIFKVLRLIASNSLKRDMIKGFVVDRYKFTLDFDWANFFMTDEVFLELPMKYCALSMYKELDMYTDNIKEDNIYFVKRNEFNEFKLYELIK